MEFIDILKSCWTGEMPIVKYSGKIKGATSNIGKVVVVKSNGKHRGVAVRFPGLGYDTWFADIISNDNRTKYIKDLEFF